jgi:3-methylcrotonyl-CoA carboxylase alpha subunit
MIAKLVATGSDRTDAMLTLAAALYGLRVWPVKTNAAFLLACLQDPAFQDGMATTGLIAERGDALTKIAPPGDNEWRLAALSLFAPYYHRSEDTLAGPWAQSFGFRLNSAQRATIAVEWAGQTRTMMLLECTDASGFASPVSGGALVYRDAQPFLFTPPNFATGTSHGLHDGEIEAPMPGRVTAVEVSQGDKVAKGQRLLTLEAMKMEHALVAPFDGTVAELAAVPQAQVTEGQLLVKVEPEPTAA